ncbi:MAG: DUF4157 domain-containing protein [Acidobacteriota bacterium]|nr:DUF4157 domain-containing protein [Acidobacteriota bacterium]
MSEKNAAAPAPRAATRVHAAPPQLARKCGCAPGAAHCPKCQEESNARGMLQRNASSGYETPNAMRLVGSVLRAPGQSLDRDTRAFMESRFGYDFSDVRIHTGEAAAASAQAVGAHAYTIGGDIVFDHGKYDPRSSSGRELLAHELAHTIQQSGMAATSLDQLAISHPGDTSEREADDFAHHALSGEASRAAAPKQQGVMRLARFSNPKPVANPKALAKLQQAGITEIDAAEEKNQVIRRFQVQTLHLPKEKGPPSAMKLWVDKTQLTRPTDDPSKPAPAAFSGLETVVEASGSYKGMLKAQRSDPKQLRRFWLTNVNLGITHATKIWQQAGGYTTDFMEDPLPAQGHKACQVDHIIELHIGGADAPPNMQMLSGPSNTASQAAIRSQITGHAGVIKEAMALAGLPLKQVAIRYLTVDPDVGHNDPCTTIEAAVRTITADPNNKVNPTVESNTDPYEIIAMGLPATLRVGKGEKTQKIEGDPTNEPFAGIAPGLRLQLLHLDKKPNTIDAIVSDNSKPGAEARLPITVTKGEKVTLNVVNKKLAFPPGMRPNIEFTFPYLSSGTITKLDFTPDGLHAVGSLIPTIKLLSSVKLGIDLTPKSAVATLAPNTPIRSPFGGLHFHDPKLSFPLFPEFKPSGSIGFYFGNNKQKPVLGGTLMASVEGTDFIASADVTANLPGLDSGTGKVNYHRTRGWSGNVHLSTSAKKILKEVSVDVAMDDEGVEVTGTVLANVPGTSIDALLTVHRAKTGEMTYSGESTITIPKFHPAKVKVVYGTQGLTLTGSAGFTLFDKTGEMSVWYRNGAFGGELHNFGFTKGRATVTLEVLKYANGRFSATGSVQMPLGDKFTATGRVTLDDKEQLSIAAALKIAKPIPLFDQPFKGDYTFFTINVPIPIPGASIGNLAGLQARVIGSLKAGYSVGPAVLQEATLEAGTSPFAKDTGTAITFQGLVVMPAEAYISGTIAGEVAISAFIAEVAGGLSLEAKASLKAMSRVGANVMWTPQRFTFHGELAASLGLDIGVSLNAYVVARAGLTDWFSTELRKDWVLGLWTFKPGLDLSMQAAFDYASDQPFQMPTINFNKPPLDGEKMIRGGMSKAEPAKETER